VHPGLKDVTNFNEAKGNPGQCWMRYCGLFFSRYSLFHCFKLAGVGSLGGDVTACCPREPLRRTAEVHGEAAVAPKSLMPDLKSCSNFGEEGRLVLIASMRGCCQLAR